MTYGKRDKENLLPNGEAGLDLKLDLVDVQTQCRYKAPFFGFRGFLLKQEKPSAVFTLP